MHDSALENLMRQVAIATAHELQDRPAIPRVWVTPEGAAAYLSISLRALEDHRRNRTGPTWHRAGGRLVRYKLSDLDYWLKPGEGCV